MPADLAAHIEAVARHLLGEPNRALVVAGVSGATARADVAVEVAGEHRDAWFIAEFNERENEVAA